MAEELVPIIINAVVVLAGSFSSIQLITYKIERLETNLEKLETKVEKHNNLVHRTAILEKADKYTNDRLDKIEKFMQK